MNYAKSKAPIVPDVDDTPAQLNALRNRLQSHTQHEVPFFLMPVRVETRFMKVERNLLEVAVAADVKVALTAVSDTGKVLTGYTLYQGFDDVTLSATIGEIRNRFQGIANTPLPAGLSPAGQYEMLYHLEALQQSIQPAIAHFLSAATDQAILQNLGQLESDITGNIVQTIDNVRYYPVDETWQNEVSAEARNLGDTIRQTAEQNQYLVEGMQNGQVMQAQLDPYLNATSNLLPQLQGHQAFSPKDIQYIWQQAQQLAAQFKTVHTAIEQGTEGPEAYREVQERFFRHTVLLEEAFKNTLAPGIPQYRLQAPTDALGADPETLQPSDDAIFLVESLTVPIQDAERATNQLLGQEAFNTEAFTSYARALERIGSTLYNFNRVSPDDTSYIWTALKSLSDQFVSVQSFLNKSHISHEIKAEFDGPTLKVANAWNIYTEEPYAPVSWFSPMQIVDELWIRAYPDDIFINSHERGLTDQEVLDGKIYWNAWWAAHGDTKLQLTAWQALVAIYGPERAAWIARALTPKNLSSVVVNSPVFNALDKIGLLNTYTTQLSDMAIGPSQAHVLARSYWDFYTPQLDLLQSDFSRVQALPESYARRAMDMVASFSEAFNVLGDLALNLPPAPFEEELPAPPPPPPREGEEPGEVEGPFILNETIDLIQQQVQGLVQQVQSIPTVQSWNQIYSQTPQFPVTELRDGKFTEASYSNVLPDRFLFAAVDDFDYGTTNPNPTTDSAFGSYEFRHIKIGNSIPKPLYTGIDPINGTFTDTSIGELQIDPKIRWMFDFDKAVADGMATIIRLVKLEPSKGFDKILVLGLKLEEANGAVTESTLPGVGKQLLERLLENHHYTAGGLSLLPLGTPTNNTEGSNAGYRQPDPESLGSFKVEVQAPLFGVSSNTLLKKDGQWLADALGIDYSALQHVAYADKTQVSNAIAMNRALFNGTVGNYMREMMNHIFTDRNIEDVKKYFTDYVLGRGALPSIRIAEQPYGIQPVTTLGRWEWKKQFFGSSEFSSGLVQNDAAKTHYSEDYETILKPADLHNLYNDRFNVRFSQVMEILNTTWLSMSDWYVKTVDRNTGSAATQKDFIEILGTDALMAEAYSRLFVNDAGFNNAFRPRDYSQKSPRWSATGVPDLPNVFFNLFKKFEFPFPIAINGINIGGMEKSILDTTELLSATGLFEPSTERRKYTSRIATVNHLQDHYNLYGPTVDEKPNTETEVLPQISGKNYIEWLRTASLQNIWRFNDFSNMRSRSLLFLLLRQSTLTTYRDTAWDILEREKLFTKAARKMVGTPEGIILQQQFVSFSVGNNTYQNLSVNLDQRILTKWHLLFRSLTSVNADTELNEGLRRFTNYRDYERYSFAYGYLFPDQFFPEYNDKSKPSWENTVLGDYLKGTPSSDTNLIGLTDWSSINELNNALDRLKSCSTAELDRLLREHIDLCSYRLDAWNAGMVHKRLWQHRNTDGNQSSGVRKTGTYLGAYGWLLDVRPKNLQGLVKVQPQHLPSHLTNKPSVYYDPSNLGFIQTPSIAHAFTAALLRSGYVSENKSADNRFAVNLTSERVQAALSLLEGIQQGQTLNALLGYELERGLHERHPTLELDEYIYKLRRKFPLSDPAKVQNNMVEPSTATGPAEDMRPALVIDGVELLHTFNEYIQPIRDQHPDKSLYEIYLANLTSANGTSFVSIYQSTISNIANLPPLTDPKAKAILMEVDRIMNYADALGDLAIAEGVFQIASGNAARSAAVLEAWTEGKNPVDPEIIKTPTSGYHLAHKLVAMVEPFDATAISINPWSQNPPLTNVPLTARAKAEPSINLWLSEILFAALPGSGNLSDVPNKIGCIATYMDSSNQPQSVAVSVAQLQLQPLDLVYAVEGSGYSDELINRVRYFVRDVAGLSFDTPVTVNLGDAGAQGLASFNDLQTLFAALTDTLSGSRWLKAEDFLLSSNASTAPAPIPLAYNISELEHRVTTLRKQVNDLLISINLLVNSNGVLTIASTNDLTSVRSYLFQAAELGVAFAVPDSATDPISNATAVTAITDLAKSVKASLEEKRNLADQKIAEAQPLLGVEKVEKFLEAITAILGDKFKALPHFSFDIYPGLQGSITSQLNPVSGGTNDLLDNLRKFFYQGRRF